MKTDKARKKKKRVCDYCGGIMTAADYLAVKEHGMILFGSNICWRTAL